MNEQTDEEHKVVDTASFISFTAFCLQKNQSHFYSLSSSVLSSMGSLGGPSPTLVAARTSIL